MATPKVFASPDYFGVVDLSAHGKWVALTNCRYRFRTRQTMATASMSLPETRNICFGFILSMRRKRMNHSLTGFALAFSFPSTLIFAVDCS
jgi:hypothetical protein